MMSELLQMDRLSTGIQSGLHHRFRRRGVGVNGSGDVKEGWSDSGISGPKE
jgi:hypothetical protein